MSNLINEISQELIVMASISGYGFSFLVKTSIEIGLFNELKNNPSNLKDLAKTLDVNEDSLKRFLRVFISIGFIKKVNKNYECTPLGQLLQSNSENSLESVGKYLLYEPVIRSMLEMKYTLKTNKAAFEKANGVIWHNHLKEHPEVLELMENAMKSLTNGDALKLVDIYEFEKYNLVVDIGGGKGQILSQILSKNPNTNGVLFDQPSAIESVAQNKEALGVNERCELIGGDMFEKVPAGGDLYLVSKVLNNWNDDRVLQLLKNIRSTMSNDSKLLIVESLVDDYNISPMQAFRDLLFLICTAGGKLRSKQELSELIEQSGLTITSINSIQDQFYCIECKINNDQKNTY